LLSIYKAEAEAWSDITPRRLHCPEWWYSRFQDDRLGCRRLTTRGKVGDRLDRERARKVFLAVPSSAAFNIASYTFLPVGRLAVPREEVTGRKDFGTDPMGVTAM
jgi:hypothetical protein